ncbi:MAG: hypothetical protein PVI01_18880, partial [Gemmatimonadales bacterium]
MIHFSLKEVEWIRKLATRLCRNVCRNDHDRGCRERDLERILELAGSVARTMRQFLDEARRADPGASPRVRIGSVVAQAVLQVGQRGA